MVNDKLSRMIQVVLKMADMSDTKSENGGSDYDLVRDLSYGYLAFSGILRAGVKAVIDLQQNYHNAVQNEFIAKSSEEDARDFLEECFGDREIDCINEKDKKRILELCNQIRAEWENES